MARDWVSLGVEAICDDVFEDEYVPEEMRDCIAAILRGIKEHIRDLATQAKRESER